jgi:pyruvate, orthophosphate dikinase
MRYVYPIAEGEAGVDLVGGKGHGLAEMTLLGLPVPPGFTITTEACRRYLESGDLPAGMWDEVIAAMAELERRAGRSFGGDGLPLLVSVRSGAAVSMPGMMDTVLNLGMNEDVSARLAEWGGERFALDARRRFVQMYATVVYDLPTAPFEKVLADLRAGRETPDDAALTVDDLASALERFGMIVAEQTTRRIPDDPMEQLAEAVEAVFLSWNNRRAKEYRRLHGIPHAMGTAATVQQMVFGDLGDDSGTGVCFTRDPATGEAVPYGDFLPVAQGEDVVAGLRDTLGLDDMRARFPDVYAGLQGAIGALEAHFRDMCDVEFTVERGTLWLLQSRSGKRTARAAVRMAVDMVAEGLLSREEAVLRVDAASLDQLLHPRLGPGSPDEPLCWGVAASPGAATGEVVLDPDRAVELAAQGRRVLLVRPETTPEDIHGMAAAQGILTGHGGKTSHAAVVARGMGTPAVTGAVDLVIDREAGTVSVGAVRLGEGDMLTIDGTTGAVYTGSLDLVEPERPAELDTLLGWADGMRRLRVLANADSADDAVRARAMGAEGIGLARTEHMFGGDRLDVVRRIILEDDPRARLEALGELEAQQVGDFESLLEAMDGLPVIARLLDPPLHEFLPDRRSLEQEAARLVSAGEDATATEDMAAAVARWEEANPMLGLRGARLAFVIPDLYRIQVQAALEAVRRRLDDGGDPRLEIMVPLVASAAELSRINDMIQEEIHDAGRQLDVVVGTMIELPRACILAAEIAAETDFFSFGTNDLTQTTFGLSRDDAEESFLRGYVESGILSHDPFQTIDEPGVGHLIRLAIEAGRAANPDLEIGVCGEHGGDPASIDFFHRAGIDYVSCSPPRVAAARLAAAQAALRNAPAGAPSVAR